MIESLTTRNLSNYQLIDSGLGRKLEEINGKRIIRQAPMAIWHPSVAKEEWEKAVAVNHRKKDGGGEWKFSDKELEQEFLFTWTGPESDLQLKLKFTPFGHCGVFFEHIAVWNLLQRDVRILMTKKKRPKILNLFSYTGGVGLALAKMGAEVDQVDGVKSILEWGQENAKLSSISDKNVRFITEDALKFVRRCEKEGRIYDGIIADPPTWGHGPKKEKWDYNQNILEFTTLCHKILDTNNSFFFLSGHTENLQNECLRNLFFPLKKCKDIISGNMGIEHVDQKRILPVGIYVYGKNF